MPSALPDFTVNATLVKGKVRPAAGTPAAARLAVIRGGSTVGAALARLKAAGFKRRRVFIRKAVDAGYLAFKGAPLV